MYLSLSLYLSLSSSNAIFWHITVLYQNEKYWPHAVFWQHILDLGYFMFSKVNILGKINIFRTCFVLQKWIWSSSLKKNTQCSNKTIRVCGDAPTPLYTNSHITYQQSSSSFHLEKYLFTENDIYFSEQIFISLNINLKLKSAWRTKYLFYQTLLYPISPIFEPDHAKHTLVILTTQRLDSPPLHVSYYDDRIDAHCLML